MAVHAVRNTGHKREKVTARFDCERIGLVGKNRFERDDLVGKGFPEDGHIDVIALFESRRIVEHAAVLHTGMSRKHAMGGDSSHRQARPFAMAETCHEGRLGRAVADSLNKTKRGNFDGTHHLRRSRSSELGEVERFFGFRQLVRAKPLLGKHPVVGRGFFEQPIDAVFAKFFCL